MTRPFDAYHVWLGIPPSEQPPDHYRLLGVPLFEPDPDVIEQAAERQTAFLRQMEAGPHRETAQRILREIAQARATLLNPATRGTYDEVLRHFKEGRISTSTPASASAPPSGMPRSMPSPLEGAAGGRGGDSRSLTGTDPTKPQSASKPLSWVTLPWRIVLYFWNHPGATAGLATFILIAAGAYLVFDSLPKPSTERGEALHDQRPADEDLAQSDVPVPGVGVIPSWSEPSRSGAENATGAPPETVRAAHSAPVAPPGSSSPGGPPAANPSTSPGSPPSAETRNPSESPAGVLLPGLLGRITVGGEDLGVMLRYTPGDAFGQAEINRLLTRYGLDKGDLELRLEGIVRVDGQGLPPFVDVELAVVSPLFETGGTELSFRGQPIPLRVFAPGEPPKVVAAVPPGDHRIAWTLKGTDLGAENRLTAAPMRSNSRAEIAIGYSAELLRACGSLPTLGRHSLNSELAELSPEELAGVTVSQLPPAPPPAVAADARLPIPPRSDQAQAKLALQQKYRKELADANRPETRSLLARTFMNEANQEHDNTLRYVLRTEARDLAISAGDPFLAVEIGEVIAAEYRRDVWEVHVETLGEIRKSKLLTAREPALTVLQSLTRSAVREDRYDAAKALADIGEGIAQEARDVVMRDAFKQLSERAVSLMAAYQAIQDALAALQTNGDDPAANEAVGRFHCLVKQDWKTGLPYLAKAEHAVLRAAARNDSTAPTSPAAQLRVADDWWALAESLEGSEQAAVRRRAGYWYLKTERFQSGENLVRVRQRLAESGRMINLIAAAATRKAAFLGTWQVGRGILISSPEPLPRAVFQVLPPEEYDVVLELQPLPRPALPQRRGQPNPPPVAGQGAFMIGLPLGRSSAVAVLDWLQTATNTHSAFLANYDGKGPDPSNPTLESVQIFRANRPNSVVCQVRAGSITVQANGVPVIEYQGDPGRLSLPREIGISSPRRIFFATLLTPYQVSQAELRDVGE
ncbi:MAG: hypothetical protein ACUVQQ_12335 [Thermogutta sp.]